MTSPKEHRIALPVGEFRMLEWPGDGPKAIFLHGLANSADIWNPTLEALAGRCHGLAPDLRGHGESPMPATYRASDYARDILALADTLGDRPLHLVGHSMGGRVAIVTAAMRPGRFASVTIVDIGPEAWQKDWIDTFAVFDAMPSQFASRDDALAYNARGRTLSPAAIERFLARLVEQPDGSFRWKANHAALKQTVKTHRSRGYWREWAGITDPLLLIRGGTSNDLRPHIAAKMRKVNMLASFEEFPDTGHNIPILAPERLAESLTRHWDRAKEVRPC